MFNTLCFFVEELLERDPAEVFMLLSNPHCRLQRQDSIKVLPSGPQPVLSVPPFPSCLSLSRSHF